MKIQMWFFRRPQKKPLVSKGRGWTGGQPPSLVTLGGLNGDLEVAPGIAVYV